VQESSSTDRTIALVLLAVLAVMLWPIWLAAAAAERQFTWMVVASGLVPLGFSLLVIAAALRLPSRLAHRYQHGIHALGERLHAGTHRHA
jgi:sterol desaturase/sphingolipid hydroxylase (fatty acid hydroxylase superfamily)